MSASRKNPGIVAQCICCAVAVALLGSSVAIARTEFSSMLDIELSVPGGAVTNKFGFATSFPRPAAPPPPAPAGANPIGQWTSGAGGTGVVVQNPNPVVAQRKDVAKGRGLKLQVGGTTNATAPGPGWAVGEGWASGRVRFRLGNFTGRPGLPAAQDVTVNLDMKVLRELTALATNDPEVFDEASARYIYELVNVDTGAVVVPATEVLAFDDDFGPPEGLPVGADPIAIAPITIPADTFWNLELFAHVYAAGVSETNPPVLPVPAPIAGTRPRMLLPLPDPQMEVEPLVTALFGDAFGQGQGQLLAHSGVTGNDPHAVAGFDTVMLEQALFTTDSFFDVQLEVEAPVNDVAQIVLEDLMLMSGGQHGFAYEMQLGAGVGDQFQMSLDPFMLGFQGPESQLPPQELTGAYELVGANDPQLPTQLLFQGQQGPGQPAQFQLMAQVHDIIDGVIDGMARFTLRQFVEGFGGDYNADFQVDGQDAAMWQQLYGTSDFLADGNANGYVGGGDYLSLQRQLVGEGGVGGPAATAAVPEPTSVVLVLMGMGSLAWARTGRAAA